MAVEDNFCCDNFKDCYVADINSLRRGVTIVRNERGVFFLRFSCVDEINKASFFQFLSSLKGKASYNLTISGEQAISYCPWCGSLLNSNSES